MTPKPKMKKVKAWAVWDKRNVLNVGTHVGRVFHGLYIVSNDKKYLEEQWSPYKIIPCTITYKI